MNPLDVALEALNVEEAEKEAFAFKPKPLDSRAQQELQMWNQWNDNGRTPEHLRPLVRSLQPLVKNRSRIFAGKVRDIPPDAIHAEFQDQLLGALETFDPSKSQLNTWVTRRLMKANRFINTYQNPARIGEKRTYDITRMNTSSDLLRQKLGREPTAMEIADHAKMPISDVQLLQKEVRKAYPMGFFEGSSEPMGVTPSRTAEVMKLLPYDLTPDENAVFERVYGTQTGRPMGTGAIAKQLGMSAPKVSRLKKSIAEKWKAYGG